MEWKEHLQWLSPAAHILPQKEREREERAERRRKIQYKIRRRKKKYLKIKITKRDLGRQSEIPGMVGLQIGGPRLLRGVITSPSPSSRVGFCPEEKGTPASIYPPDLTYVRASVMTWGTCSTHVPSLALRDGNSVVPVRNPNPTQ